MKTSSLPNQQRTEHHLLDRLIHLMVYAILGITVIFGVYYFWDRYVHPGDMSPIELGITHLESVVQASPDDHNARLSLIQYYIDNKNYSEAIEQSQQILNAYPDNPGALLLLGIAYTKTDQNHLAIDTLNQFVSLRKAAEEIQMDTVLEASLYYIGQNYLALKQPAQAIEALSEAVEIDPTDADAMYLLGTAHVQVGQYQQAIASFLDAVRFVPDYTEAYHGLSECYSALNQPDMERYAQGMEAFSSGDYINARQILEQAAVYLPDFPEVFLGLALTYEQLGDSRLAQEIIQRVLELDPNNISAQSAQKRILSELTD